MGILYRNSQGIETPVAGLAPAGQLVPSVSLYQSGSFSVPTTAVQYGAQLLSIIFTAPMPDTNYEVTFSGPASVDPWYSMIVRNKTVNGFDVRCICLAPTGVGNILTYDWQAFKLMTDEVTALDEAKIEQNTANFAPNFSATASYSVGDYCTYQGVLYRCTVAHTASAWNNSHFTQVTVGGQLKVQDISSSITTGDGYSSGTISVYRDGNTVQVLFNSVQTTAYDRIICSGLPRPLHNTYFCVQADGNPQELGLGALSVGGSITSGNSNAGMGPSKVWDGFITYLTRD